MTAARFGYCPKPLDWERGEIAVATLPDLAETVEAVASNPGVKGEWIWVQPYTARVFGLPQTHTIEHATGDEERLDFLVWCLSFLLGIRLTTTEAGFLDATPIKCGKLNDIVWCGRDSVAKALDCADRFWIANAARPRVAKALTGIINSYFLSQNPIGLGFERFTYLYVALEGCHFVYRTSLGQNPRSGTHSARIAALCSAFNMQVPAWADPSAPIVADRRNETLHEGLFFDEPLGFAGFGGAGRSGWSRSCTPPDAGSRVPASCCAPRHPSPELHPLARQHAAEARRDSLTPGGPGRPEPRRSRGQQLGRGRSFPCDLPTDTLSVGAMPRQPWSPGRGIRPGWVDRDGEGL